MLVQSLWALIAAFVVLAGIACGLRVLRPVHVLAIVLPPAALFGATYLVIAGVAGRFAPTDRMVVTDGDRYAVLKMVDDAGMALPEETAAGAERDGGEEGDASEEGEASDEPGGSAQEVPEIEILPEMPVVPPLRGVQLYTGTCGKPSPGLCVFHDAAPTEYPVAPLGPRALIYVLFSALIVVIPALVTALHVAPGLLSDAGVQPLVAWWKNDPSQVGERLDAMVRDGPAWTVLLLFGAALVGLGACGAELYVPEFSIGAAMEGQLGPLLRYLETTSGLVAISLAALLTATSTPLDLLQDSVRFFDGGQAAWVAQIRTRQLGILERAHGLGAREVLIIAHSQGTLVASMLTGVEVGPSEPVMPRLVTLGSPIGSLYRHLLPSLARRAVELTGAGHPQHVKNLWFDTDYVGRAYGVRDQSLGFGGHTRYFDLSQSEVRKTLRAAICPAPPRAPE
ncbi:MAG: hypothetical protein R3F61_18065 [Myxococcota bacterium]